ncbi:MAG TPA: hypothetical protein VEY11_04625 [Pyrinomonadaceae bacterium]|nr:hypothetical protein [Pyrinomonadaceae bacterium]
MSFNRIFTIRKIFTFRRPLMLLCGLLIISHSQVLAADASVDEARAVLVQLAAFSGKQALHTAAARKLLAGEMLNLKISSFGRLTDAPDAVFLLSANNAVGRFQLTGERDQITDVYFYLEKAGGWKVNAVRLMALTGMIEQAYLELKAKPNLTEAEKNLSGNFKLTLAPDRELKMWFAANRETLDALRRASLPAKKGDTIYVTRDDAKFPEASALLRKLNLSAVGVEANGNVEIVIGGVTDNTVGFIHSPAKTPPPVSPSSYIWVEEVAPHWYLFRTT